MTCKFFRRVRVLHSIRVVYEHNMHLYVHNLSSLENEYRI